MKKIGHIDGAMDTPAVWRTHSLGMLSPHDLYIPNPGERENVDADRWHLVGWINPDSDGGVLCGNHATAGEHGRPAYIERAEPVPVFQDKPSQTDPMDIRRSEFDALSKRIDEIDVRLNRHAVLLPKPDEPTTVQAEPSDLSMHAFQISTDDLIKEALEFCRTELDAFDGIEYDSDSEVGCQRANVYIRELIGRLHGARQPKPAPTVQAEPPMSFYDHAFIAAYTGAITGGGMTLDRAIEIAHRHASIATRNRAVPA